MIASLTATSTNLPVFVVIDSRSNVTNAGWPWEQTQPQRPDGVIVVTHRLEPDEVEYFPVESLQELRYRRSSEAIARHVRRLRRPVRPVRSVWRPSLRAARVCSLAERWRASP